MILEEMTTDEVEAALQTCQSVIIPLGVMEAHGPHLPLSTDTIQAYDAAKRAARLTTVFVAPPLAYGYCRSLAGHPGTIGISAETVRRFVGDVLRSMAAQGFRNFIFYSGHASALQMAAVEEGADAVVGERGDINVAIVLEYDVLLKGGGKIVETPGDMHAGEIETSRIMAARPDVVRTEKLPETSGRESAKPILVRDLRRYWPSSVLGSPRKATAEKGERLGRVAAEYLANLVKRMESFDPH
jgi:creatinine amidohydrolase